MSRHWGLQRKLMLTQLVIAIFGVTAVVCYARVHNLWAFPIALIVCVAACVLHWEFSQSAKRNPDVRKFDELLYDIRHLRYAIREFGELSAIDAPSNGTQHLQWSSEWLTATFIRVLDLLIANAYLVDFDRYTEDDLYVGEQLKDSLRLDEKYQSLNLALKKFGLQLADPEQYREAQAN